MAQSAELGCAKAYYNLGCAYYRGDDVQRDMKKAKKYSELATLGGYESARHSLAVFVFNRENNIPRVMKHYIVRILWRQLPWRSEGVT